MKASALAVAVALACRSSSSTPAPGPSPISPNTPQLITAVTSDLSSTGATLRHYTRTTTGWQLLGSPWQAVLGKSGLAWGDGLHGKGAPPGRNGPVKREGDGTTPAGAFAIRAAYGYAPPPKTRLAYTQLGEDWECIDDPASTHYTRILDRGRVAVDWRSSEKMLRADELYTWVIDIAHNPTAVRGRGSCIFFHVWSGPDSTTQGCTAMASSRLADLVATLEPDSVYVVLARGDYDALAPAWGLPPL